MREFNVPDEIVPTKKIYRMLGPKDKERKPVKLMPASLWGPSSKS
jgi:hypothetical protein